MVEALTAPTGWRKASVIRLSEAAAAANESPKKFYIFHNWNVWKSSSVNKGLSPAANPVIAASHPEYKPCVMRKAVRQSVYDWRGRQPDPKETATDF